MSFEENKIEVAKKLVSPRSTKTLINLYVSLCRHCKQSVLQATLGKSKDNIDEDASNKMRNALNNLCPICSKKAENILGGSGWI